MRRIRRGLVVIGIATAAMAATALPASAHVHGFTPLLCLTTDNPNSGAVVGFAKAADAAGPLNGPGAIIPQNASGKLPSGGQGAEHACDEA